MIKVMKEAEKQAYRDKAKAGIESIQHGAGLELINKVVDLCQIEDNEDIVIDKESYMLLDLFYSLLEGNGHDSDRLHFVWDFAKEVLKG